MFRLIFRQRRRLMFTSFFITLGLMMYVADAYWAHSLATFPLWISICGFLLTSLIVALAVCLLTILVILIFPNWRMITELMAIVCFTNLALGLLFPSLFAAPYIGEFMPLIIYFGLFSLTYGEFSDRFRIWVDHNSARSFISPKSAPELWTELVPGEGPVDAHWDNLLCALHADPEDPDTYDARYTLGASLFEHQTMTILEKDAPHFAKYHHVGDVHPSNRSLVEGTFAIRIDPLDTGGCRVTLEGNRSLLLLRIALGMWFDDYIGDQTDHLRARHHGRRDWSQTGRFRRKVGKFA